MSDRVLILGASGRAAAASARRAGLTPFVVDLFADRDTLELCGHVVRCPPAEYPAGLFDRARRMPPMPWLYTGGLENYPELVGELAAERELWGNDALRVRLARHQTMIALRLRKCDLVAVRPRLRPRGHGVWVRKPWRSAGGRGVRLAVPGDGPESDVCYQEFVSGRPMSAVLGGHALLATHQQFVGEPWLHADRFAYCGNLTAEPAGRIAAVSRAVADVVEPRGVWGFDWIDRDGTPVLVEVNPRYPASVEVAEFATGTSLLRRTDPPPPATRVVGKVVYYAGRQLAVPAAGPWDESLAGCGDVWRRPDFVDIPHPGDVIEPGQPVVTLLADGPTEAGCLATLKARAAELDRLFGVPTPEDEP